MGNFSAAKMTKKFLFASGPGVIGTYPTRKKQGEMRIKRLVFHT